MSGKQKLCSKQATMHGIPFPVRFKKVTAPLDEIARARLCESSGSEHSAGNSLELADLVDSFMEIEGTYEDEGEEEEMKKKKKKRQKEEKAKESDDSWLNLGTRGMMKCLLGVELDSDDDLVRRRILKETEIALPRIGMVTGEEIKRRLMYELRERGLDAGLCKSRWEKSGRIQAGEYEYVDVIGEDKSRYIVELALAGEFDIARPTISYSSLLAVFPTIFVGKSDALKQVVKVMCNAAKESIKNRDMHLPPWRRSGYMQGKWFGSYKRTTNSSPSRKVSDCSEVWARNRPDGFVGVSATTARLCRGEVGRKEGIKAGNLAAVLRGL